MDPPKIPDEGKKEIRKIDVSGLKKEIERELQRKPTSSKETLSKQKKGLSKKQERGAKEFVSTGIEGFDKLFEKGIPKGSSVLIAGGSGCGKTTLCSQILSNNSRKGVKCLYMSFEESEKRIIEHMEGFGFFPQEVMQKKNLLIKRFNPFDITRSVDALLMEAKGELLIEVEPILFPDNFKPEMIVVDSLTAIASAFSEKDDSYRIYIEQLFRFFEKIGATSFLITETKQIPTVFSPTGVEEFLADAVIVLYNIRRGSIREKAIEVLKLRGAPHMAKIVSFIIGEMGIEVYPDQEIFSDLKEQM